MTEDYKNSVHEVAGGEILIWLEAPNTVRMRSLNRYDDPIDMGEGEAESVAQAIAKLLGEDFTSPDFFDVKPETVYEFSNNLVAIWMEIGGVICIKVEKTHQGSVKMDKKEAMVLANMIMAFVALV